MTKLEQLKSLTMSFDTFLCPFIQIKCILRLGSESCSSLHGSLTRPRHNQKFRLVAWYLLCECKALASTQRSLLTCVDPLLIWGFSQQCLKNWCQMDNQGYNAVVSTWHQSPSPQLSLIIDCFIALWKHCRPQIHSNKPSRPHQPLINIYKFDGCFMACLKAQWHETT